MEIFKVNSRPSSFGNPDYFTGDVMTDPIIFSEIEGHINDQAFADKALEIFDGWVADGTISPGDSPAASARSSRR